MGRTLAAPGHAGRTERAPGEPVRWRLLRTATSLMGLGLALGGCASFSPDAGLSVAGGYASLELRKDIVKADDQGIAPTAETRVDALLRHPLTADGAVQVALLRNRGLQAAFNDLGVSEAQYVQATLPPSPRLSITQWGLGFNTEIERSVAASVLELVTLPARAEIARQRFGADQYNAADQVLRLAGEARRQYYRTVAANQATAFLEQALAGAESASTLAKQLGETGALNKLEQAREHAFYSELGAQLAKARVQQRAERERLTRLLGLWGRDTEFRLPNGLPPLPGRLVEGRAIEAEAMTKRADVQAARFELQSLVGQFGLNQVSGFVSVFDVGFANRFSQSRTLGSGAEGGAPKVDKASLNGFTADLVIPVYDFGATAVRGARESYLASANRLAERAVNARSEVREAYQRYRGQYDITRHYRTSVLPLRRTIQDQTLLQYSGMLLDVTTLIVDARARILSNIQAIEAQRDFWIAATDLKAATVGGGFSGGNFGGEAAGGTPGTSLAVATPGG
ncbi:MULTISPECIES: TolC family protein [Methylobacterium]|uniref:Outer membrane protein TolC n=2 Tax=Methylobacterium TaxID=407 RepID=A0ABV2NCH0_9HYPH|nr:MULTISPECIES: TolC family protein [Methylobacterium]MCX7333532.1 TolC family protein [Hyphomicrobiales bacterium]AYO83217.1 TolC family protein [Methylobacterium brachiatum]MBP2492602.1 outer membrane protein TolC [Methylobacterium sp. PvP105]MBP2501026.1 outer membrane protein TolC [Methylobacterium sp. PvP109]MDQ0440556.1 outer membrane protein TolC [Methylobacterium persicinum]